ncbi:glycosyltransferase family 39 protein [Pontibacter beigongshangensis]|uniref:glycosyltransferase family 39 protein n=1 Tax=Pontibacter beigongshangensis TaxID=2574733 RepID=UPI0016502A51|nr:glycosyltransferase family 39 protein [Pontibacter beigongshangensis]
MQVNYKAAPTLAHTKQPVSTVQHVEQAWLIATWILLAMGLFFRLFHFFDDRSLWLDEVYLATSLAKMDLLQLTFSDLKFEQKAPLVFLWMCKAAVMLFGKSDMAFRLFPLLCGILSLFLFLPVARYFLRPWGVAVAVGLLALAPPLVYHSVEIKQYSAELLATVMCLYLYTCYQAKRSYRQLATWGLLGALIIWISFTSIFILAGIAIALSGYYLLKKEWKVVAVLLIPFSMWLASFIINYLFFTSKHAADSEWLLYYFRIRGGFMPLPPDSLSDLLWPLQSAGTRLMHYPLGLLWDVSSIPNAALQFILRRPLIGILCAGAGLFYFYRRNKKVLLVLLVPYALTLVASALEAYPMYERLTVFLAPIFILIIATGCERLISLLRPSFSSWALILPALLLAAPLWTSASQVVDPDLFGNYKKDYYKEAFLHINDHYNKGDQVYIYWNMLPPYRFYKDTQNLSYNAIEGSDFRSISKNATDYFSKLSPEIEAVKGAKRVWLLYSKTRGTKIGEFERQFAWYYNSVYGGKKLHNKFRQLGKELAAYETPELKVVLFELKSN